MSSGADVPRPLLVATAVAGLEGLCLVAVAITAMLGLSSERLTVAVSVSAFFALCAGGLLLAARSLVRAEAWARGPVLLTQLILLGVVWQARSQSPLAVSAAIVVVALIGLVAMLHPASSERLSRE